MKSVKWFIIRTLLTKAQRTYIAEGVEHLAGDTARAAEELKFGHDEELYFEYQENLQEFEVILDGITGTRNDDA